MNHQPQPNSMKSPLCLSLLKAALLIAPLALCFGGSTVAQAGGKESVVSWPNKTGEFGLSN